MVPNETQNNIWQLGSIHSLFSMSRQTCFCPDVFTVEMYELFVKMVFWLDKIGLHSFYQLFQVLPKHLVIYSCFPVMMSTRDIHNRHSLYKVVIYSQGSLKELLAILYLYNSVSQTCHNKNLLTCRGLAMVVVCSYIATY